MFWIVGWLALILLVVASSIHAWTDESPPADDSSALSGSALSGSALSSSDPEQHALPAKSSKRFVVTIRRPAGPPLIALHPSDTEGTVGRATCSTCHSMRAADPENRKPSDLNQFHQNMPMAHGELACYACHNPSDSDTLRLADGSAVEYSDVMDLCSQCHSRQSNDYTRGIHGGMAGYWDLSRGGRVRNNCIDCHDPHVPKFPTMQPTFKPRDRFLTPPATPHHETDE